MMERPCFSSSFARENTARAPSPFNCETREAILRFGMKSRLSPAGRSTANVLDRPGEAGALLGNANSRQAGGLKRRPMNGCATHQGGAQRTSRKPFHRFLFGG